MIDGSVAAEIPAKLCLSCRPPFRHSTGASVCLIPGSAQQDVVWSCIAIACLLIAEYRTRNPSSWVIVSTLARLKEGSQGRLARVGLSYRLQPLSYAAQVVVSVSKPHATHRGPVSEFSQPRGEG